MRMLKKILLVSAAIFSAIGSFAQNITDVKINEVMLFNETNYIDSYGDRSAWIELVNTGYNTVNIAGCYLTNNIQNPTKYKIPTADPITKIPKQQFLVFFADGRSQHGTLHLNFRLDSINRFIALFASDGKTLLDSVTVPLMGVDKSFVRLPNGFGKWQVSELATPNSTNDLFESKVSPAEKFVKVDPFGVVMAITAMSVVFTALLVLYRLFSFTARMAQKPIKVKLRKSKTADTEEEVEVEVPGEVFAAISAALYFYENDKHDQESTILTIERVSRRYSPWSSKIYTLRQTPNRVVFYRKLNKG
ncbi:OadG family transporter subunit [Tenuifilum thalassicum]|uniref:Lamin tail domain-containing protein n=1 Tax=Tenuifilum thalassicum TaxID=2590900 RepID=A0A7D4C9R3_9BACT|nr:OadG family transporter subunit [Tenuifilum thalassicum]QKG80382.1 lamin tail domain-containing protein [Tenuifilum thalassicum]